MPWTLHSAPPCALDPTPVLPSALNPTLSPALCPGSLTQPRPLPCLCPTLSPALCLNTLHLALPSALDPSLSTAPCSGTLTQPRPPPKILHFSPALYSDSDHHSTHLLPLNPNSAPPFTLATPPLWKSQFCPLSWTLHSVPASAPTLHSDLLSIPNPLISHALFQGPLTQPRHLPWTLHSAPPPASALCSHVPHGGHRASGARRPAASAPPAAAA